MTKLVTVKFDQSTGYGYSTKTYTYRYNGDKSVEPKDIAVVISPNSGYTCVTVVKVEDDDGLHDGSKQIVEVISLAEERKRLATEKKKKALKAKIDKAIKEQSEIVLYEQMAKNNPDLAALVEEFKALG